MDLVQTSADLGVFTGDHYHLTGDAGGQIYTGGSLTVKIGPIAAHDDAELTTRAFREARIANPIVHVTDGVEALDFLFHRGTYAARDNAVPSMVLLDLKLPRLDGLAVLQAIRENETTRNMPVIMMTSSDDDRDRLAAYDRHVNSYIKKPINYDEFVAAARQLGLYWIVLNLPAPVLT